MNNICSFSLSDCSFSLRGEIMKMAEGLVSMDFIHSFNINLLRFIRFLVLA